MLQLAEVWHLRVLLRLMTIREIRARFSGSSLGIIWLYVQPLLTIATYYLVFDVILDARLGDRAPTRSVGLYLVVGMVPWMAFSDAVSRAMHSLLDAGTLLQKNALAPVLFPARAVLASVFAYLPPLVLVIGSLVVVRGFSPSLLALPVIFAAQFFLSFLLGYSLAILAAAMRDVIQVAGFCLSLGIFASPILFTVDMVPDPYSTLIWMNPMTPVVLAIQSVLFLGEMPPILVWVSLATWIFFMALLNNRLIRRSREHLVDWL